MLCAGTLPSWTMLAFGWPSLRRGSTMSFWSISSALAGWTRSGTVSAA
jgi:hypothetical protein